MADDRLSRLLKRAAPLEQVEHKLAEVKLAPSLDRPPGLEESTPQANKMLAKQDTFAVTNPCDSDLFNDFMTQKEKDIIAHLHALQLRSTLPSTTADYYYQAMSRKARAENKDSSENDGRPLYFPTIQYKKSTNKKFHVKPTEFKVEGSLGSISKASAHRPRTQFQPPKIMTLEVAANQLDRHWDTKIRCEAIYDFILRLEEAQSVLAEDVEATQEAQIADHRTVNEMQTNISTELGIDLDNNEWYSAKAHSLKLTALLELAKGRRVIGKSIAVLPLEKSLLLISRLIHLLDQLACIRAEGFEEEHFLSFVISVCVTCVAQADVKHCADMLQQLVDKPALPWLLQRKTGLIVLCMLLSRLEVIKGEQDSSQMELFCEQLHDLHLAGHLVDVFFNNSTTLKEQNSYYTWQLLALIAVNVDGERKRGMVLELRETVMNVVESKNQRATKNMNIFLNALGLDASQLV